MNSDKLSQRLETVATYIPNGSSFADIGSDHAYLPCYVVRKNIASFAIAGEVVEGPFQSAKKQVEAEGLTSEISVRKGDGLSVIERGEVDCITIAGMGGSLISTILEQGKEKLPGVKRLVLQPNVGSHAVRQWLYRNDWVLIEEEILEEDGKIYEVLVAETGTGMLDEKSILMGPFLMQKKGTVFQKKWCAEVSNWQKILKQLEQAEQTDETARKKKELLSKIQMVEEVLQNEEC